MKKLLLLLCLSAPMVMNALDISYGVSCSTITNKDDKGNFISRDVIPSKLFGKVEIGVKQKVALIVDTNTADMYSFDYKKLDFHFNPDKINYTLQITHSF